MMDRAACVAVGPVDGDAVPRFEFGLPQAARSKAAPTAVASTSLLVAITSDMFRERRTPGKCRTTQHFQGWRCGKIRGLPRRDRAFLKRHLVRAAVATALTVTAAAAGTNHGISLAAAAGVPPSTSSYYVYGSFVDVCGSGSTTECPLYNDGSTEAVPAAGGMTILDFGAPCFEPVTIAWGTQLFNSQSCTPDTALVPLAQAWVRGYEVNPHRAGSAGYVLAIGTSNSLTAAVPGNALTPAAMTGHGQAWFTTVIAPLDVIAQGLPSRVTIWAGDDIEQSSSGDWYDGPTTTAWVDAYAAASGASKPCIPSRSALMVD